MPSLARAQFDIALADVDALIQQAKSFSKGKRGAPASVAGVVRPGRSFTHAAAVLLAGAIEGYVEAVVTETATAQKLTTPQMKELKERVKASHGASVRHVHGLTAHIGLPFVLDTIGWRGLPAGGVRTLLDELSTRRNKVAHGAAPKGARVADVERWRKLAARFADELDTKCAAAVMAATGATTAPW